jgi:hypothetical protein
MVTIKANRTKGADGALTVASLPLPTGLAVPAATIAEKAIQGTVPINTTVEAPLGRMTIVLQAKGKLGADEVTLTIPAITLNLVRPAEVALAASAVDVKPGSTAEVKGKVVRKGTFKEPVTVRINGLPAGLKSDPVTVAPGTADFIIKVVADGKAPAATATVQLVSAYQVNKKEYPTAAVPLALKVLAP